MYSCSFSADKIFSDFKVIDFPKSFVGLEVTQNLNVAVNLNSSAYIQTIYDGSYMNFEEAREISANHRAFVIEQIDKDTLKITFKPTTECIFKGKLQNFLMNRFVICLSVIQIDGKVCCGDIAHQEIGRYYINGEFESINIFHRPEEINFGNVAINSKASQNVRFFNESDQLFVNLRYVRVAGFNMFPDNFTLTPKSSKNIKILANPDSFKASKSLKLQIRNSVRGLLNKEKDISSNFLSYTMKININIKLALNNMSKIVTPESLHKLIEPDPRYMYMEEEQELMNKRKNFALKQLEYSKSLIKKNKTMQKEMKQNDCQSYEVSYKPNVNFCANLIVRIPTNEVLNIFITPFYINLGKVGITTAGETILTVNNNTKYAVDISFLEDKFVKYTNNQFKKLKVKMKPLQNLKIPISVFAHCKNETQGTFPYVIDDTFYRLHPYCIQGEEPRLEIKETNLKFGMVTSESYITAISMTILNNFNECINFCWDNLGESPFTITPISGSVSKRSTQICNISFDFRKSMSKIKTYTVDFVSMGNKIAITPLELNIISRKMGVKFLQAGVYFKETPLNLEVKEKVQLENASKEIASFYVVEPLLPGIIIEPMRGIVRPKNITIFNVILKIACVMEFTIEVTFRINGKENLILPISGHIIEPNVTVHPKNIYMARIPGEMIAYLPVTFENQSNLKSTVDFQDSGNINDFIVCMAYGYEKQKINYFTLEGYETKTVYVKVCDDFRRQFDLYLPFKINGFIGPPTKEYSSLDLGYYTGPHEMKYEHNAKVKIKPLRNEICFVHLWGVITIPWIKLTPNKYEINYVPGKNNSIEFTMENISKYDLNILLAVSKLAPHFTLEMTENNSSVEWSNNGSQIKFILKSGCSAELVVYFHPKGYGRFVSVALLYFLKQTSTPFHNLTFIGNRCEPEMEPDKYHIIFPPNKCGCKISQIFKIKLWRESTLDCFSFSPHDDDNLVVDILDCKIANENENISIITVKLTIFSEISICRYTIIRFLNSCGSHCEVEVFYCFSHCPLTLLASNHVNIDENPYPYYPESGTSLYEHMEAYIKFLQKWMYLQGFRRELYPIIPDTIHATSTNITLQAGKSKGVHGSYINFVRRIAGPLLKISKMPQSNFNDQSFENVKELHDTYKEILLLLRSRGANAWVIKPSYLLSYEQFAIYTKNIAPKCKADKVENEILIADENLFNRLNKQSWFDFILQTYKVFVIDTCFFKCVCLSNESRDIVKILIDWYNDHISLQQDKIIGNDSKETKIENIVNDLTNGLALTSVFLSYCPFLNDHFSPFMLVNSENYEAAVVNNACLLIEAVNMLKLYFPLNIKTFLTPNFLEMFFLSIHLYVILPMFKVKQVINFNPPLLRSSTREMMITASNQESLTFCYFILNSSSNNFTIEKSDQDKEKKVVISVRFACNFLRKETALLLVQGFNKTRIFDTYMIFILNGEVGSINPVKKCKVVAPLYRLNKVDVLLVSPFESTADYKLYITDVEPVLPVSFEEIVKPKFYLRRLNPVENVITLKGHSSLANEPGPLEQEQKVYFYLICLSNQVGSTWVWFRSQIGEFYIRVMTHPRSDLPIDYLEANLISLPIKPCSCGEECECYRTTAVLVPHRNDVSIRSLKQALTTFASELMLDIFDKHIGTVTGRIVLTKLLREGGTLMSEVDHIMKNDISYKITSRSLKVHSRDVTLSQHSPQTYLLPITVLSGTKSEKFNITLTSRCGLNVRTYKVVISHLNDSNLTSSYSSKDICQCNSCNCDSS